MIVDNAYAGWRLYALGCTDFQLRNVFAQETERLEQELDSTTRHDSTQAVSACRVVAAERGIELY